MLQSNGKDTMDELVRSKSYSHEELIKFAKETDKLLLHLLDLLHGYKKYLNEAYKIKQDKLQEIQAKAIQTSIRIAEETLSPLIAYEIQMESNIVNEKVEKWNKLLIKGLFVSISSMMLISFFLRKGLLIGCIVGVSVMIVWLWGITKYSGLMNDTKQSNNEEEDQLKIPHFNPDSDDPSVFYDPHLIDAELKVLQSSTKSSTKAHVQYLNRMNMMNRALEYVSQFQDLPDQVIEELQSAKNITQIYKESYKKRQESKN